MADRHGTVWATGQTDLVTQLLRGGYDPDTAHTDPAVMPPTIAAHAVAMLTRPADLILDPDCGAGTTVVEALHGGRHAIGLAGTPRMWRLARTNVTNAKAAGAPVDGMVLVVDRRPNTLATAHAAGFAGRVDLIVTTLRPRSSRPDATTLANSVERLRALLADTRSLLRPGGHVVVTTAPYRSGEGSGELLDVVGQIMAAAATIELVPLARCIALTGSLRHGRIYPWDVRAQRRAAARFRREGKRPVALTAHHTALIFGLASAAQSPRATLMAPPPDGIRRTNQRFGPHTQPAAMSSLLSSPSACRVSERGMTGRVSSNDDGSDDGSAPRRAA